ncbi:MAG TPA: thiamine diphosphokinase [Staphylococcus kloosii]|uniref:Thiamine diphosphokinase n=1 Tax=Staphylococcus kloosii TaxID=29384 RepID=A0A921H266_9STAP|nr:thiamine diphosphokinase [Staphylococcus kloosii]HJF68260.1 thiamine diphosphokinase [Staphylococcus kloosii]
MHINLLCSDRNTPEHLLNNKSEEKWGGVDRGALILYQNNIEPEFTIGDFDSVNDEERQVLTDQFGINPVKAEKDDTDLAIAVEEAVQRGFLEINIYGATGGRLDHFMGALQILEKPEYQRLNVKIIIIDQQNVIQYLTAGCYNIQQQANFKYVSFIPVNYPTYISLINFKYPLEHQNLEQGSTLTISNELDGQSGIVELHEGAVLMIQSTDK